MRVLLTGAAGNIGRSLRPPLRERVSRLRVADFDELEPEAPVEEARRFDVTDFEAVRDACRDIDAVVHLAGIPTEAAFERIAEVNLRGTYNVYEGARLAGVRRVVFASSNHATGFYGRDERISPRDPVRPDTFYGVSKVFGEALGSLYADKFGLEVVALRIGAFAEQPPDRPGRPMWISPGDMFRLTWAALTAPDVRFEVVYGVSDTGSRWWDNEASARRIGYEPQDRLEARDPGPGYQGAPFTDPAYHGEQAE
ncbi:MAG: NAD(P)-dependent oxidoreductase [Actinomycetota bacterium]|nr:NAD(P)-dependent oxidoreductase [Actinomycetota bacterium]